MAPVPSAAERPGTSIGVDLPSERATGKLAAALAALARVGDIFALAGDLGTGKTVLARAFIRARGAGDEEVPSPTFTLVQSYELSEGPVHHFDLYRLDAPDDALELGIEEAFSDGISLIEWPERLGPWLPRSALTVDLALGARRGARQATLSGDADWMARLAEVDLG